MAPTITATPYDFPRLRVSVHLDDDTSYLAEDDPVPEFFDVKFCPYQPLNARPVFAAVSKKHVSAPPELLPQPMLLYTSDF